MDASGRAGRRLASGSRALTLLRGELEAMGSDLAGFFAPADAVAAWIPDARGTRLAALAARARRLSLVRVSPGPLPTPYDAPHRGFASLRVEARPGPRGPERTARVRAAAAVLRAAGYGHHTAPDGALDAEERFAREWLDGVAFFDAWTRRPIALAEAVAQAAWLEARFAANAPRTVLVGVSGWKRETLDAMLDGPDGPPLHVADAARAVAAAERVSGRVAVWATRMPARLPALCEAAGVPMLRIEDGFLRSVGLGASFRPGASVVVDSRGIYYDPRGPSDLAHLLATSAFPDDLVARATRLRETIVARRLSKYNVGVASDLDAVFGDVAPGRRVVLVPGQVEDDASVQHGSPTVRTNRALLEAARARNPDAFLLYKPHPDVEAGYRPGRIAEEEALTVADRLVGGLSIVELLDRTHHVETMTSLTGFEALLRGRSVAVHGRPFYAGWGLTEDLNPDANRGRRLALDELVAGALLLYPLYVDPVTLKPCPPELLLDRLTEARAAAPRNALALSGLGWLTVRARYALLNPIVRWLRDRRGVPRPDGPAPGSAPPSTPRKSR